MSAIESTSSLRDLEDKLDRIIELLEEVVGNQKGENTSNPKLCKECGKPYNLGCV